MKENKVGERVKINGKEYEVTRDSTSAWVKQPKSNGVVYDFAVQPINAKTGKPWQAEQLRQFSELDAVTDAGAAPREQETAAWNRRNARDLTCRACGTDLTQHGHASNCENLPE